MITKKATLYIFHSNSGQKAYLTANYDRTASTKETLKFELIGPNATTWSYDYPECQKIYAQDDISVKPANQDKYRGQALFSIDHHHNWLYTKSLFTDQDDSGAKFKALVRALIGYALTGNDAPLLEAAQAALVDIKDLVLTEANTEVEA
ncbi:hypothetical protein [Pseudoalteromonas rubra]|uniref:hypothetical protein n=1 Tax=Pseudoalteromonas rubra TaxID=43658 RepID=UPI000F7AB681|nr:hypothetical protein [Pseudoalteromonas rubra]